VGAARRWGIAAAVAALAAAGALGPLARAWLAGLTVLHRDQTGQYAGVRTLVGEALRHGHLPLWNPFCATGMPLLADPTHGALHPLSVAVAFLFPSDGLDPLVGAWIASAAVGAAALARALGASRAASLVAALAYGTSGWTLSMTSNLVGLAGAGSAPWVAAGLLVAARGGALGWAAGAAGVAAGALAGDVQALTVSTGLGLVLAGSAEGSRGAARAAASAVNGGLLAAIQLVPSWSFLHHTDRILPLPGFEKDQWDLVPWRLVEFVSPGFFTVPADGMGPAPIYLALGHPTLYTLPLAESVFLGIAVLVAAAAGVGRSRQGRALLASGFAIGWLAMGRHAGARVFQDLVPVASGWRYGEKYLTAFVLVTAALAALGTDRMLSSPGSAARWARVSGAAALLALVAWAAVRWGGGAVVPASAEAAAVAAAHLRAGLLHAVGGAAAATACLWAAARGRPRLAAAGLVAVVGLSGWAASGFALRPGSPEARFATPPPLRAGPPAARVLVQANAPDRPGPAGWDPIDRRNFEVATSYSPNTNVRWRVDAFGVDSGLTPLRWRLLGDALGAATARAGRRYGVTHVVAPAISAQQADPGLAAALDGARLETVDPRTGLGFWAVPHRDWAGFPSEAIAVQGLDAALDEVVALERARRRTAVIELEGARGVPLPTTSGVVLEAEREAARVRIVADAPADGVLVVNEAFWPGWRATVDGRETPIAAADGLVRAVLWPRGRHTLEMTYEPPEIRTGALLSVAGVAALAAVALGARRRRGRGAEQGGDA
jgi:hypothetical protein